MPLSLPPQSSPLRDLFDVVKLSEVESEESIIRARIPEFMWAKNNANVTLKNDPGVDSVVSVCIRDDGELWLVAFNRRSGWKRLWSFGKIKLSVSE